MEWLRERFYPTRPPRERATLDGLRIVRRLADTQMRGERLEPGDVDLARKLLSEMPSWEDLYERDPSGWGELFDGGGE